MNSSESSVIVLDSDDEEDQNKCSSAKTTQQKSNVPKTYAPSKTIQSVRNSITLTPAIPNQQGKSKTSTTPILKKTTNSVSIIPLNQLQTQKVVLHQNSKQITKSLVASKISPKTSPRNSPILKIASVVGATGNQTKTSSTLESPQSKTPQNLVKNSTTEKNVLENKRNINHSELKSSETLNSKPKINNSISAQSLKRKLDSIVDDNELNSSTKDNQKSNPSYKRIKPTLVSSSVNPKWNQPSNTILIDDDDEMFESSSKSKESQKSLKPRSSSVTSSSSPSPSTSTSSTATSPQSRSSATTPSPSLKDINRSTTPKGTCDNAKAKNVIEKEVDMTLPKTSSKELENSSSSSIPNGNIDAEKPQKQRNEIIPAFKQLINACQKADKSSDMELLIEKKLLRYYHSIHPDYITSKSFKKTVENITSEILETPNLVYIKLKTIIEELKSRRNSKVVVVSNDGQTSTGNDEIDEQVRKLNKGLRRLKHIIAKLEEQEVDWDNDSNSSYLKVERFKKRACEIYEKICDLTGESKHAQRTVRKPIIFDHTAYPKINKAIETFVNKTKTFPDFHDIFAILQHCNKNLKLDLSSEELKRIAQDAFVKVGKLLQNRRKTDLYETLSHYTEKIKDPALEDHDLSAKLNDNKKHYGKINALIQKYAREQDTLQSEKHKAKEKLSKKKYNVDSEEENSDSNNDKNNLIKSTDNTKKDNSIENICRSSTETKSRLSMISEEVRNTPSCSNISDLDSNHVKEVKLVENKEVTKEIEKDKTHEKSKTIDTIEIDLSSNKRSVDSNKTVQTPKVVNTSETEVITDKENIRTSNVNSNDKSTIKIVNVASLCDQPKINASAKPLSLDKSKISLRKSIAPSSLGDSTVNKNKNSNKELEVDQIILSDDDV